MIFNLCMILCKHYNVIFINVICVQLNDKISNVGSSFITNFLIETFDWLLFVLFKCLKNGLLSKKKKKNSKYKELTNVYLCPFLLGIYIYNNF